MDTEEFLAILYERRARTLQEGLTLEQIGQAVAAMEGADRTLLVQYVKEAQKGRAGDLVVEAVKEYIQALAKSDVDAAVADGALTIAEVEAL
jgi:hypothetical protein